MFTRLFLLFVTIPLIELYTLISIGSSIGVSSTILLVLTTGALGAYFAKREGFAVWTKIQKELQTGNLPKDELIDGVLLLVAGIVLITPGIFTDIFGIILLIPQGRIFIRKTLAKRFKGNISVSGADPRMKPKSNVPQNKAAEVSYTIVED